MDIRSVDLNLLVVFDAMLEHRSVSRGAASLGLSQPAMSAALTRLRELFGDPLFVRIGSRMQPSPRASELASPVRRVIETVQGEILQKSAFDARATRRTFTLITPDIGEVTLLPKLLERLAILSPNARIRTVAMQRTAAAEALEAGRADLAVGFFPDLRKAGFFQQRLFRTDHACLVSRRHPRIKASMTSEQFFSAEHVVVRPGGRDSVFEQFLAERGLSRRVVVEVSHFMSLPPIIAGSRLIATVPRDLADIVAAQGRVRVVDTPMRSPAMDLLQYWHARVNKDPASLWLRGVIRGLLQESPADGSVS